MEAVAAGPERFAVLAAETTARMLSRAVSQRGRASVGFSGGSTAGACRWARWTSGWWPLRTPIAMQPCS